PLVVATIVNLLSSMLRLHTRFLLFPYTTLFRSQRPVPSSFLSSLARSPRPSATGRSRPNKPSAAPNGSPLPRKKRKTKAVDGLRDRKSTRLNSSHVSSSYAVFCLKKKTRNSNNK